MNIEDLSIFGLYSQKENKVTAAFLQVIGYGGASLLRSFISSFVSFVILPIILLFRYQLRCREPVTQPNCRVCSFSKISTLI